MAATTITTSIVQRLQALAATISANVDAIAGCHAQNLVDGGSNNDSLHAHQAELLDSLVLAQHLITDAPSYLTRLQVNHHQFSCVRWLFHFDIPTLVPLPSASPSSGAHDVFSTISYSEVASKAHVPEHQLRRIARMAMLTGFFIEPTEGQLAHTPLSASFATSPGHLEWGKYLTSISAPMTPCMVEATEKFARKDALIHLPAGASCPPQLPPNQTAYAIAWNTDLDVFGHVKSEPELGKKFAAYMRWVTLNESMSLRHLITGYDWTRLGADTTSATSTSKHVPVVVDIGGGMGHASFALAKNFPHLRFLVQDLPEVIARAETAAAAASMSASADAEQVKNIVAFQAHDFFHPQPELPHSVIARWTAPTDATPTTTAAITSSGLPSMLSSESPALTSNQRPASSPIALAERPKSSRDTDCSGNDSNSGNTKVVQEAAQKIGQKLTQTVAQIAPTAATTTETATGNANTNISSEQAKQTPQEESGGHDPKKVTAFILRQILHDWRDDDAALILKNLLPNLDPEEGRILIMDTVLPLPSSIPTPSPSIPRSLMEEAKLRVRDLTMLQAHNAYEREIKDWHRLVDQVNRDDPPHHDGGDNNNNQKTPTTRPKLILSNITHPPGSLMAILELKLTRPTR